MPRGGSQAISDALASYLREQGGAIHTGYGGQAARRAAARPARTSSTPRRPRSPGSPGSARPTSTTGTAPPRFKIDYALSGPVPWTAKEARAAGTVHIGPTAGEIDAALRAAVGGPRPRASPS